MKLPTYLEEYVENNLIYAKKHPHLPLWICNYTPKAIYDRKWDDITLTHRGRVVNSDGETIIPCLPKFFNYSEHSLGFLDPLPETSFEAYEKLDGSYISVHRSSRYSHSSGDVFINSRGNFTGDIADLATKVVHADTQPHHYATDHTYIFELIGYANTNIVHYPFHSKLVLIAAFDADQAPINIHENAAELPFEIVHKHDNVVLEQLLSEDRPNAEGYILQYQTGTRVKIKHPTYVSLHKVLSNLTDQRVFDAVVENTIEQVIAVLPDESYDWVKRKAAEYQRQYDYHKDFLNSNIEPVFDELTRKQVAIYLRTNREISKYASAAFALMDGKYSSVEHALWKIVKDDFDLK